MWEPDPSWRRLPGAAGPASGGLWRAARDGRTWVVKRLDLPEPDDPARHDAAFAGYWRREAEVARDPARVDGPGLVPAPFGPVEEDETGVTVWTEEVTGLPPPSLFVARALGRFAGAAYDAPPWAARTLLADRLALAERRGGWPTLARTTLADVTDRLWRRREHWLSRCAGAPQGRVHGDAVPRNFLATRGEDVVAVDWQCTGVGPVGADLGYYALSCRESFEVLLDAFLVGAGPEVDPETVRTSAAVTAVYSVVSRAEWALGQVARGEGALAGKYRHPAVAPHLRALQRQFPQIERLVG